MNDHLHKKEEAYLDLISDLDTRSPVTFVIGSQRSGSTLLQQLLINCFNFFYPNNIVARFWGAPLFGTALSRSIQTKENSISLNSDLGFTRDPFGPHEFGYFWKKWFSHDPLQEKTVDFSELQKILVGMEILGGSPLLFKNLIHAGMNIGKLHKAFNNILILHIKRDPLFTIQSTYESRIKHFNDAERWFGVFPPKFREFGGLSPLVQISKQVLETEKHLSKIVDAIPDNRIHILRYEELVTDTKNELHRVEEFFKSNGLNNRNKEITPPKLESSNKIRLSDDQINLIKDNLRL